MNNVVDEIQKLIPDADITLPHDNSRIIIQDKNKLYIVAFLGTTNEHMFYLVDRGEFFAHITNDGYFTPSAYLENQDEILDNKSEMFEISINEFQLIIKSIPFYFDELPSFWNEYKNIFVWLESYSTN